VAIVLPPDIVASTDENATHEANPSSETWIEPAQAPAEFCPVRELGFIA
jgi:hypothetical protein